MVVPADVPGSRRGRGRGRGRGHARAPDTSRSGSPASASSQEGYPRSPTPQPTDPEEADEEAVDQPAVRKKKSYVMTEEEEKRLVEWIQETEILWNSKLPELSLCWHPPGPSPGSGVQGSECASDCAAA